MKRSDKVKFYMVLGNHDYSLHNIDLTNNSQVQVDYGKSKRYRNNYMPLINMHFKRKNDDFYDGYNLPFMMKW